ncbi:MAG TPA: hypothetical protein DD490_32640 [Acidobacteria bacterium]|nr:hypothetical protein [Acidobacteriota bacterium]
MGADSYLKKPFDSQELLHRVEELLAAVTPPAAAALPGGADVLAMPSLTELPAFPDDLAAAPTDWGSYDLEASPAPPEPAEPFPAPVPFPVEARGTFDEAPFPLVDAEPAHGGTLQVDESALLPAGEVLFDFDAVPAAPVVEEAPSFATPSFEELPAEPEPFEDVPSFEARPYNHQAAQSDTLRLRTSVLAAAGFDVAPEASAPPPPEPPAPVYAAPPEPEPLPEPEPEPVVEALPELPTYAAEPAEPPAPPAVAAASAPSEVAPAAVAGNGHLSDADVDRIARRVVELMADRAIRDVAWEVIPDMAEMVIRDRLRELESQAESFE